MSTILHTGTVYAIGKVVVISLQVTVCIHCVITRYLVLDCTINYS